MLLYMLEILSVLLLRHQILRNDRRSRKIWPECGWKRHLRFCPNCMPEKSELGIVKFFQLILRAFRFHEPNPGCNALFWPSPDLGWFQSRSPAWFQSDYWNFLLSWPKMFHELNEVEDYYRYFKKLVDFLHQKIRVEPSSKRWRRIAMIFAQQANSIPLYFRKKILLTFTRKELRL